jgi:glycosyltransferase involved in cell wall biosynthesis
LKILMTMNLPVFPAHGGANRANRVLAALLAAAGHQVEMVVPLLSATRQGRAAEVLAALAARGVAQRWEAGAHVYAEAGVEVRAVPDMKSMRSCLLARLAELRPDVILVSSEDPSHNLLDAALSFRPERVVCLVHTPSFLPFGPLAFFPSARRRAYFLRAGRLVTFSRYAAAYIKQWGDLAAEVVPLPVFGSGPFPRLGHFDRGAVLMVNPCANKGIEIFLGLARGLPDVAFAAVPTWGTNEADLAALRAVPNIELRRPCDGADELFAGARVVLMPSLWVECFGLTVIEALLRAIPVLASDLGGLPEAKLGTAFLLPVRPIERFSDVLDENGLPVPVVAPQDLGPWRAALDSLLSDRALYERESAAGAAAASAYVGGLSIAPLEEILRQLVRQPRQSAPAALAPPLVAAARAGAGGHLGDLSPMQLDLLARMVQRRLEQKGEKGAGAIALVRRGGPLPLSFAQQRLWFIHQMDPESPAYNMPSASRLEGDLKIAALAAALREVVRRHEVLRACFAEEGGRPVQVIAPAAPPGLPLCDLSALPRERLAAVVHELAATEAGRPFDLARAPLLRTRLLCLARREHVLLLTLHHIVGDGWSSAILLRELILLYQAIAAGRPSPLPELAVQYADFACWQRDRFSADLLAREVDHWRHRLGEAPLNLSLRADRPAAAPLTARGATLPWRATANLLAALRALAREQGATLFMVVLAAFAVALRPRVDRDDMVIGTDVANRRHPEVEGLIGFFVNQLVLRVKLDGDASFSELLAKVREVTVDAYAHQDLPFERLVEALQPRRDFQRSPLFQVKVVLQNRQPAPPELPGLRLVALTVEQGTAKIDLLLNLLETADHLLGALEFRADLFEPATVRALGEDLLRVLEQASARPEVPCRELLADLAQAAQRRRAAGASELRQAVAGKLGGARRGAQRVTAEVAE